MEERNDGWYRGAMSKHRQNPSQDKCSRIERWLLSEGWSTNQSAPTEGWSWIFAGNNGGPTLLFSQPVNKPDQLLIQGEVEVAEVHRKSFNALSSEARETIIWDLRFDLLKMGVEFIGIQLPFGSIFMRKAIYDDGLTKDAFMQRTREVHRAVLFIQWTFSRYYKEPPNDEPKEGFFVN